jgi:hypothetical protein
MQDFSVAKSQIMISLSTFDAPFKAGSRHGINMAKITRETREKKPKRIKAPL